LSNLILSKLAEINNDVEFICKGKGRIIIDDYCHIKKGVVINTYGGVVHLHAKSTIGEYCVLYGHGGIEIGEATAIAPHCTLSAQHHIESDLIPLRFTGEIAQGIKIGQGCLIGAHTFIGDNVEIGEMCIIGASSTVLNSIPNNKLAYGTPCKDMRDIVKNKLYGLEYESDYKS
jgi:acetyltransferase-like isoleucine patch superfamily enzyme